MPPPGESVAQLDRLSIHRSPMSTRVRRSLAHTRCLCERTPRYPGLCKRCVMMFLCGSVIGPGGRQFFLDVDMSMGCSGYVFGLKSSVGSAAMVLGVVTTLIPL